MLTQNCHFTIILVPRDHIKCENIRWDHKRLSTPKLQIFTGSVLSWMFWFYLMLPKTKDEDVCMQGKCTYAGTFQMPN
jgi:hypothetical protein